MRQTIDIPHLMLWLVFVLAASLLCVDTAHAQAVGNVGNFSCSGGTATGQLYNSNASCPTSLTMGNMFSFLVCNMEQLSSNLMGHMYCGMIQSLAPMVWAVATLAVVCFGILFTIGVIPATGREAIVFALKLAFITGFATNADLLIGVGYKLLISGVKDGVSMVLAGIGGTNADTGDKAYALLDGFLAEAFRYATDSINAQNFSDRCKNAIFAVLGTMAVAFPILAYLGLLLLARIVMTFLRAVFGYIYAMVGITFLLVLAPFFLSFFFFKQTHSFFDKWLGYLVSFTLQMVFVFAGLAFILSIDAKSLTSNLSNIVMYHEETLDTTAFRLPWQYCTLCDFKIVDRNNPGVELTDKSPNFIADGELQCKSPKTPIAVTFAMSATGASSNAQLSSLIKLAGNGIMALLVLAVVVERLLTILPALAQKLASSLGATYASQLGGGASYSSAPTPPMPGGSLASDFSAGFQQGFKNTMYKVERGGTYSTRAGTSGDGISSTIQGVRDGFSAMITGRTPKGDMLQDGAGKNIGAANRFKRWMSDPNRFGD